MLKFFLNSSNRAYLRGLEEEFGESTNAIRLELNKMEQVGMITGTTEGNKKYFSANTRHPLFRDLNSIIRKYVGIDTIIENVINQLGDVERVYLTGAFAKGLDNQSIDLEMVGGVNLPYLNELIAKAEALVKRDIRCIVRDSEDHPSLNVATTERMLIWSR